ncbi:MAG: DUF1801 domain-containing protein [Chloroflexi bacterium]|nr:DUF1801 domain-containing protein [Chloroflexota bacterium]
MSAPKLGTFDDLLGRWPEAVHPVAVALRETVFAAHPGACETVRLGYHAATYGVGPRMTDSYAYIMPHARWVNLGLYQGAVLPDPEGLLEGTGARLRHVKVRTVEEAERLALKSVLSEALARQTRAA